MNFVVFKCAKIAQKKLLSEQQGDFFEKNQNFPYSQKSTTSKTLVRLLTEIQWYFPT